MVCVKKIQAEVGLLPRVITRKWQPGNRWMPRSIEDGTTCRGTRFRCSDSIFPAGERNVYDDHEGSPNALTLSGSRVLGSPRIAPKTDLMPWARS